MGKGAKRRGREEGNTNREALLDAGVVEPVLAGGALDHLGVADGVVRAVAPAEAPHEVVVVVVARVARAARRLVRVKLARAARGCRAAVAAEAVLVVQLHRVVLEVAPQVARKAHTHLCACVSFVRRPLHSREPLCVWVAQQTMFPDCFEHVRHAYTGCVMYPCVCVCV